MTVLIDSWAWIEYFRGGKTSSRVESCIMSVEEVLVSTVNVAEVHRWMLANASESAAKKASDFMMKRSFTIPVTSKIAIAAAKIKHEKKWGLGDSFVLATAQLNGAIVMTGDPDFKSEKNVEFLT